MDAVSELGAAAHWRYKRRALCVLILRNRNLPTQQHKCARPQDPIVCPHGASLLVGSQWADVHRSDQNGRRNGQK
jgi:hypothetical protein